MARRKNPEQEARELELYANNLGPSSTGLELEVYRIREQFGAMVKRKPLIRGKVGPTTKKRLMNLCRHAAHRAARAYSENHGSGAYAWKDIFTDADLEEVAHGLYDSWLEEYTYTGNPKMRKKRRTAKQIAATKKLVAFNKRRRKGNPTKKKTARRKKRRTPAQIRATKKLVALNRKKRGKKKATRRKTTARKRNPRRPVTSASRWYQIFKCKGNSVHFAAMSTDGKLRWTLTRRDTVRFASKAEAAKIARRLAKSRKAAGFYLGVAAHNTSTAAIVSECKGGKA